MSKLVKSKKPNTIGAAFDKAGKENYA